MVHGGREASTGTAVSVAGGDHRRLREQCHRSTGEQRQCQRSTGPPENFLENKFREGSIVPLVVEVVAYSLQINDQASQIADEMIANATH